MTRHEKLSLFISLCALLVSISSPIITYYWFDPALQSIRNKPRIIIEALYNMMGLVPDVSPGNFAASVKNNGKLPAKELHITIFRLENLLSSNKIPVISVDPHSADNVQLLEEGKKIYFKLRQPLAPNETLTLWVSEQIEAISFITEFGDQTFINFMDSFKEQPSVGK